MTIMVSVVADSVGCFGHRLTTVVCTYPRFIHSELLTHRAFSRNSSSSRAIPARRVRAAIRANMVEPAKWGKNQQGMQARTDLSARSAHLARAVWRGAGYAACAAHWGLELLGVHKQITNRIVEPWSHITTLITATEWANFFRLRIHPDAQPEMCVLASEIQRAMFVSKPVSRVDGEWHLPFVMESDRQDLPEGDVLIMSVARCARVSYLNHAGRAPTLEQDRELYMRLRLADPAHLSPFEHQARPVSGSPVSGNFMGWEQFRKHVENDWER